MPQDSGDARDPGTSFDIAPLSSAADKISRMASWFILSGGLAILLFGLALIVPALLQAPHDTISCARSTGKCSTIPASQYYTTIAVEAAVTGGLSAVALMFGAMNRRARRPVSILISRSGLRFNYANGPARTISWGSRGLSITLVDRSLRTPAGSAGPSSMFTADVRGLRRLTGDLALSKPVFDAMLSAARTAGVRIDESVSTGAGRSPAGTKIYVLRPARALP